MMDHSPLLVVVILGMCLLVESHRKPNCDNHPTVTGAANIVHGHYVIYRCTAPYTYNGGGHLWNCWTRHWRNTGVPMTCSLDGGWSSWGDWDDCTATCGDSTHTRTRTCDNPEPLNGGATCPSSQTETQDCTTCPCPVDGELGDWGNWGDCNPPVCPGTSPTRTRTRECDNPAPAYGGDDCVGNDEDTETGCTVVADTAVCTNYQTQTCGNNFGATLCTFTGLIQSTWVETVTSGKCACGVNFFRAGPSVLTFGGCKAVFHVCYA